MKKSFIALLCFSLFILSYGMLDVSGASNKTNLKLNNGATYYGEVKNGRPHGKGTMNWPGDKSYSGDWISGKRSGQGKYIAYIIEDGQKTYIKYNGNWKDDKYNGQGEYVKINSYSSSSEDDGMNDVFSYVAKGKLTNNILKVGYELNSSRLATKFEYKDNENNITLTTYSDDKIKKILAKNYTPYIPYIEVMKKQSDGLMKGYSYYLGMEEDRQELSEGYYNKNRDLYTGTMYKNTEDYDGYVLSNYKNGKVQSSKVVNGDIYAIGNKKVKKQMKEIEAYFNGFKSVYDISIQEKKSFKQKQVANVSSNKTVSSGENKFKDYNGTWVINDLSYEFGDEPSGVISIVDISLESETNGTASVGFIRVRDGYIDKGAGVESKFKVDANRMASFDFDDDTYGHYGTVKIQFRDSGLVVECQSYDPEFVDEDGEIVRLTGGNWSLWEGEEEFPWSTKGVEVYDPES
ncbi:hypothetical protein RE628_20415 [Paenibacillus sp. D2_2]|uniref:hypothetical protein n=1 Tax=Paenibacillus sp. D2_2 TaxID=3073092 RepID=UPI00281587D9|nr:hypothetical protein [Paenibacillus sp. D2_2]WMT39735.1 hypothetical protein RE628_20415 [Paenibacillus sp. D2_2]